MRAELIALLSGDGSAGGSSAAGAGCDDDDGVALGIQRCNALLRCMTRGGRLHPGMAPMVHGPIVNSEHGEVMSKQEYESARAAADQA